MEVSRREGPYIKIVEQPASKALRFRYECEGRSAGSIPGVRSTPENKTYPTIQIVGYQGRAVVVVSCVTKEPPYRPHPHNLVGRDGCKKGVCTVEVHNESMTQSFDHLGIQCVKKKDIEEALRAREDIRVDPFRTGFSHRTQPGSIDLNAVRLAFQAFLEDEPGKFKLALPSVVSDIIYDKKALCDLAICKLSHASAPVAGGMEMILLCEKVAKEDIAIRFYEERNGQVIWEGMGDFTPAQVHKQFAITFRTPKYKNLQIDSPVPVFIQLQRPSDKETSDPLPFQLTPLDSGCSSGELTRKKPKMIHEKDMSLAQEKESKRCQMSPGLAVKREPADNSPNPYPMYPVSPMSGAYGHRTPSPMDYNPVSPQYQGIVYATASGVYTSRATTATPLPHSTLTSPSLNASLQLPQAALGRVSPQVYAVPVPPEMYVAAPLETLPNGTYLDISSPMRCEGSLPVITSEPMENLNINSKEFPVYMNVNLDEGNLSNSLTNHLNLNCDTNQPHGAAPQQENMTDSLTRIVDSAFDKFV